jgi:mannose-1-phosphate guanylyltransferase/mannose-6-phosphate isomerase
VGVTKINHHRYAIVLCGGSGERLWPLSRGLRPKQFIELNGEQSMLQQTISRISKIMRQDNIYAVTHEDHKFQLKEQLADKYPDVIKNILVEPVSKNTLPAIAWASYEIYQKDADAIIGVFASDHSIINEDNFFTAWQEAQDLADENYLALFGIKPSFPATGYGYIKPGKPLKKESNLPIYEVDSFIEKPNLSEAEKLLLDGYFWNSGMFAFKASIFLSLLKEFQPSIYQAIIKINHENLSLIYKSLSNLSIDYGLIEVLAKKRKKIAMVRAEILWNDLGDWNSIYSHYAKDKDNNVIHGEVISLQSKDSLLWSENALIAALGVDNLIVIQTADSILICNRNLAKDLKVLVAKIKAFKPALTEINQTVYRPWGTYTVLEESLNYKIKRIVVNPGAKLSMQMHKYRSEHWIVLSGIATVLIEKEKIILNKNQSTYIPKRCKHRLINDSLDPLELIEVQSGDYVGEDDIVRFDDKYGRLS